jgi:hypothetical protein
LNLKSGKHRATTKDRQFSSVADPFLIEPETYQAALGVSTKGPEAGEQCRFVLSERPVTICKRQCNLTLVIGLETGEDKVCPQLVSDWALSLLIRAANRVSVAVRSQGRKPSRSAILPDSFIQLGILGNSRPNLGELLIDFVA